MLTNPRRIFKNRKQILEGIKNSIFKQEHIETIARERRAKCDMCAHIDREGTSCVVSGTQPCCGKCGCSLSLKLRALSAKCEDDVPLWDAVLSEEEEDKLREQLKD